MSGLLGAKGPPHLRHTPWGKYRVKRMEDRRQKEKRQVRYAGFRGGLDDFGKRRMTRQQRKEFEARERAKRQDSDNPYADLVGARFKG